LSETLRPEVFVHSDLDALSRAAVEVFVNLGRAAIGKLGRFSVALSGGSTPRRMYGQLASSQFEPRLNWENVHIFWGDERAVPPDDPQSNYGMADKVFLSRVPVPRANIHRIAGEKPPDLAAREYEQLLRELKGGALAKFDLVLLGLGANGHTASLFPHTPALQEKSRWCVDVWVPELNASRITLTAPLINRASNIIFLVAGQDKAAVLYQVLHGPYDPERLPAQLIRPDEGKLVWMVDQAAARDLQGIAKIKE
jgi:6-phosphogluconolactonase